jgi:hypothetical protein
MIETKLNWGNSSEWTNYDFESLSRVIYEETKVSLSTTTLKRIWGKLKYDNKPTLTTLNALAQFSGFDDWRSFKLSLADAIETPNPEIKAVLPLDTPQALRSTKERSFRFYWLSFTGVMLIALPFFFFFTQKMEKLDPQQFEFSANKVISEGVPNSVVFHYDASKSKSDSIFITQTWDIRRKMLVSKNGHDHSAIYYYPGYFRTKLIIDDQIVKKHDIHITSNGWLGLIETKEEEEEEEKPFYVSKAEITKADRIEIDKQLLLKNNFHLQPEAPRILFFHYSEMEQLTNDNFIFETTVKNDYKEGSNACQYTEILIQCKDDIIKIPLCANACIGELDLYIFGTAINSKTSNLTKFGTDLTQWTTLRVEVVNKYMKIFVNGQEAYSQKFDYQTTGIAGVKYRFNGVGAIKDTWFKSGSLDFKLD